MGRLFHLFSKPEPEPEPFDLEEEIFQLMGLLEDAQRAEHVWQIKEILATINDTVAKWPDDG